MKLLNRYLARLKYVYSQRCGCAIMLAIVISMVVAIILWLSVANSEVKTKMTSSDEMLESVLVWVLIFIRLESGSDFVVSE